MEQLFKYVAFISYNSKDTEWGKRLQRKLEHYRMPATLCNEHGWSRTPIKPVFFAPTDIQPGGLTEELQERLRASKNLIVICSPNSAKSDWVGKEIAYFHQLGRTKQIHFFIVDGIPHSGNEDMECFHPVVEQLGLPEILGANIHEKVYRWPWLNKERAYVQLISKLLDVEFDSIWQRHKRQLVKKLIAWVVGIIAVIAALVSVWMANQPVDVEVRLNEATVHNDRLPQLKNAVVTMTLDNETKTDTIHALNEGVTFMNIPRRFLNKQVRFCVSCRDFLPVDTLVMLSENVVLDIRRDADMFGLIRFQFYSVTKEETVPDVSVEVAGQHTVSDANGMVELFVPIEQQDSFYSVKASVPLEYDTLVMPCIFGSTPALLVQ